MRVDVWWEVDDTARAQVEHLIEAAEGHDGRSPISEQGLLHLRHRASTGVDHVVAVAEAAEAGEFAQAAEAHERTGEVVGYAQVDSRAGGEPAAELVVLPAARRRGWAAASSTPCSLDVPRCACGPTDSCRGLENSLVPMGCRRRASCC